MKTWFFEVINKMGKPLAGLNKKKTEELKSIKLERRKKKVQLTPQKYKGS